ncbi:MAG TPA: NrfD/PsrC family molybdoenzyme membrane anchor subunit [Candidatus Dormibacteraeota bacterium]|nr:NrfD/PsrC family molybdoenzyme membrane anchor subunit [Candidatus Dormibacteraeota bacterium]
MPDAEFRSYHGQPVLKPPVWRPEVPWYLFAGGLAGGSALLASAARRRGNDGLARRALLTSFAAVSVSPVLLVRDLGRPGRFLNMLRVFKVTSPMSVGSWILAADGAVTAVAAGCEVLGALPRVRDGAERMAAMLGAPLATYTAVLLSDTAVPAWHEGWSELPVIFASSALASAGAAGVVLTPVADARPALRVAVGGAVISLAATEVCERRLGPVGEPYRQGRAGRLMRAAKCLVGAGAGLLLLCGRRRAGAVTGGVALLAGCACERWAVFEAGVQSARDPAATVVPQRARASASAPVYASRTH